MARKITLKTNSENRENLQTTVEKKPKNIVKKTEENKDKNTLNMQHSSDAEELFSSFKHSNEPDEVTEQVFTDDGKILINVLKQLSITELMIVAKYLQLENFESMHTQELIYLLQ